MAKILLVEDDKSLREIYGVRLLAEGYDIVSAGDGEEALAMAIKDRPQLIISDVMMPKISGFDMLDILRSTTETKNIKVIMMTALSSEDQRQRGEQLGADRYLVKSQVGIEDVVRTVHDILGDVPTSPGAAIPGMPASTPVPRPTMPSSVSAVPPRPATAPVAPTPTTAAPAPVISPATATPAPQPASGLPQPTAPFSTPRPAGLGDRIIQPLERPEEGEPMIDRMNRELSAPHPPVAIPTPPVPAPPSVPPISPTDTSAITFEETPRPNMQPPVS
ncbi:PAS/PAC sensor hybrid histidine kinase [Candidatus Saccharibacteria bacterium RAAC3_TM7_1]|nr:PAS/PAC sensor hybrid histidine kinase [Candidatus Saccharibacteria bacterium RAAC3_TM7_1]HCZ28358.1 response regulator [Candidatus Saccharibacteria bacterium]